MLGTQRVISFLRQIVEHGGFYRTTDQAWVTIERIQFVGACNPPTDPGRKPLSHRLVLVSSWTYCAVLLVIQNSLSQWGAGFVHWWPIHIINPVDKTKLFCNTPHRCSTTVSLETYPLYQFKNSLMWNSNLFNLACLLFSGSCVMYQSSMLTTLVPHL